MQIVRQYSSDILEYAPGDHYTVDAIIYHIWGIRLFVKLTNRNKKEKPFISLLMVDKLTERL